MSFNKSDISKVAAIMGRKGGLKGGPARAASLTAEERSDIAKWASLTAKMNSGKEFTLEQKREYKRLAKKFGREE